MLPAIRRLHDRIRDAVVVACETRSAESLGVTITGLDRKPLDAPLDLHTEVGWLGSANDGIREQLEPALFRALERHALA